MTTETLLSPLKSPPATSSLALTPDQDEALSRLFHFLCSPNETVFVLSGYSGCGKSTLIRTFLDNLQNFTRAAKLIQPKLPEYKVQLTATTNKAAENLAEITGMDVVTIHSFCELRVQTDFRANTTKLIPRNHDKRSGYLVFIDEASYIDSPLLQQIFAKFTDSKIIFIGDPAQLIAVKSTNAPVFDLKVPGASLTKVVRQAEGNPIIDLATKFRHTVNTGDWVQFTPDGVVIQHLDRDAFRAKILQEFTRKGWHYKDSKVLTWTNKCAIDFNNYIRESMLGDPQFVVGDYAVCNAFLSIGKKSIKTDEMVYISCIGPDEDRYGVLGNVFTLDHDVVAFMPKTLASKNERIKQARAAKEFALVAVIEQEWVDLRAAPAQTINKAQGSTYGSVFIDLNDVARCNSGNQIARMLYVGISRAKHHVYLTGDLVG